jgi:ribonuclease J
VCVLAVNSRTGTVESEPELITRGLVVDARHAELLRDAPGSLVRAIEDAPVEERTDPGLLKERIRIELQRMFRKRAGRRPLVLPVVMEV